MKEFFKTPKAIFIMVAVGLDLAALALVATGNISFPEALSGMATISAAVFGLYQFYIKGQIITEANVIVSTANRIQEENTQLRTMIDTLEDNRVVSDNPQDFISDIQPDDNSGLNESLVEKPVTKRKYTKRKTK